MKRIEKSLTVLTCLLFLLTMAVYSPTAMAAKDNKPAKKAKVEKAISRFNGGKSA